MEKIKTETVVKEAKAHWHMVAALIMTSMKRKEIKIKKEDMIKIGTQKPHILLDTSKENSEGYVSVRLINKEEAERLFIQNKNPATQN